MDWNKFAQEVHENAVAHGWWDKPISEDEFYTMLHCELAEAVQEYRRGRPMTYYNCVEGSVAFPCDPQDLTDCRQYCNRGYCPYRDPKPLGVAVELCDLVLRILDYIATKDGAKYICEIYSDDMLEKNLGFIGLVTQCRDRLFYAEFCGQHKCLFDVALMVEFWLGLQGVDFEAVMREKHEYNKGREYRHGGMLL